MRRPKEKYYKKFLKKKVEKLPGRCIDEIVRQSKRVIPGVAVVVVVVRFKGNGQVFILINLMEEKENTTILLL